MLRWAWRHKKSIIAGSLIGAGAYGAYRIWRKKREIDELLQSVGLDQLVDLFGTNGGESSGSSSREARCDARGLNLGLKYFAHTYFSA